MPESPLADTGRQLRNGIYILAAVLFATITLAVIFTRSPWWDEGQLGDPAHTLASLGYMGSRVMEGHGHPYFREFVAYDRYTYWTVPLYLVSLAAWIKVFGYSIISTRLFSMLCGAALICAGSVLTARLTGSRLAGMLAALLLGTDYTLVLAAATVRMDIMAAALGFGSIAAYVVLRERDLRIAAFTAGFLAAAACLTHPVGALHSGGLLLTAIFLDGRRLKISHYALAAIPYFLFAGAWMIYALQAWDIFRSQLYTHSHDRLGGINSPLHAVLVDIRWRYISFFSPPGIGRVKIGVLMGYGAAMLAAALVPAIRRSPGVLVLLLLSALYYVELALLDGSQFPHYMVHTITMYALLTAAVLDVVISKKMLPMPVVAVAITGFILLQLGGHILKIVQNSYHTDYLPMIAYVDQHTSPKDLVMGPSQMQFGLTDRHLVDDARLGALNGLSPDIIILDEFHPGAAFFHEREPDMEIFVRKMLTERFALAKDFGNYHVYLRRVQP